MKWFLRITGIVSAALVVLFLIFRTPDTDPGEMRAKYGGAPSQYVTLGNGQVVHLRDEGPRDGVPIILLHGSSADLHTWQPWTQGLRDQYRVIRYDQIGHGLTGPAKDGNYELSDFARDIGQVADHLELDRFVLAGNSMGGWISAGYAIDNPDRLIGLVLVDASGSPIRQKPGEGGNSGFSLAATPGINQLMRFITPRSLVEQSFNQSVSNKDIVTDEAVDRYWELLRYPGNRAATLARFSAKRITYTPEQMAALPVPTLVMWGVEDQLVPVEAGRWYDEHLPNSTRVEYAGIGHIPMEEAVDVSLQDLKTWLKNLEPVEEGP